MRGFDHERFIVPISMVSISCWSHTWDTDHFHGLRKERLAQWPPICVQNTTKKPGGYLQKNWGGGWRHASWNPYPISDQNLLFSLPHFRPEALEPGAWAERVTSCYGTNTDGVNINREMVLSPNDEEVAPSKEHTQFKTSLTNHTLFQTKWSKLIPYFRPKRLKKHTL